MERPGPGHRRGHPGRNGNPAGHTESLRGCPQATRALCGILHGVLRQLLPGIVYMQHRSYSEAKASSSKTVRCIAQPASSFICSRCWPRLVVRPSEGLICNPGSSGTRCALFFSHPRMRSMQNNKDFTRCRSRKSVVRYTVPFSVDAFYILPDSVSLKHLSDKEGGF